MVLVDTSVWVSLYRKDKTPLGQKIWALVAENEAAFCGQIWVEFLGGFRRKEQRKEYEKSLRSFPFLETSRKAYELAAHLLADHPRLGAGDAMIAATAMDTDSFLFAIDGDFQPLTSKGLKLFTP